MMKISRTLVRLSRLQFTHAYLEGSADRVVGAYVNSPGGNAEAKYTHKF